jgi:hypothetical protein
MIQYSTSFSPFSGSAIEPCDLSRKRHHDLDFIFGDNLLAASSFPSSVFSLSNNCRSQRTKS